VHCGKKSCKLFSQICSGELHLPPHNKRMWEIEKFIYSSILLCSINIHLENWFYNYWLVKRVSLMFNKEKFIATQRLTYTLRSHNSAYINYLLSKFIQRRCCVAFPTIKTSSPRSRSLIIVIIYGFMSSCTSSNFVIYFCLSFSLPFSATSPVQYKITNGNEEGIFRIHNATGQLFIAAELDYEKVKKVSPLKWISPTHVEHFSAWRVSFMLIWALIDHNPTLAHIWYHSAIITCL
jgi:hypothetical protein